ncbi:hypothetical protein JXB27_02520 [Candidatus Woesearchaeota archaeon]|nr:hypothetical protein [Candidatus Woesearchaeota archaeon]
MTAKNCKSKCVAGASLAIFLFNTLSVFAIDFQNMLEPFQLIRDIFSQGKIIAFIGGWLAATIVVWRILRGVGKLLLEGAELRETGAKGGNWFSIALILVSALMTFHGTALLNLSLPKATFSAVVWLSTILSYTFVEIIVNKLTKESKQEAAFGLMTEREWTILALTYFGVSILVAPFASFSVGSSIFVILPVHMFIASLILGIGSRGAKKVERLKRLKEEAKETGKRVAERRIAAKYTKEQLEIQHTHAMERLKMEIALKKIEGPIANLQQFAARTSGEELNKSSVPFLIELAKAVPPQDEQKIRLVSQRPEDVEKEINEMNAMFARRNEALKKFKDEFASTNEGKEALYLLGVLKDLKETPAKWIEYVGEKWDRCDFADKLDDWKNEEYQKWQNEFRGTTGPKGEGGRELAIKLIRKRIGELQKIRLRTIKTIAEEFEKTRELAPERTRKLSELQSETREIERAINIYNRYADEINKNLGILRSSLKLAADTTREESQRRTLMVVTIPNAFKNLEKNIEEIKNPENNFEVLLKKNIITLEDIEKIDKKWQKVFGIKTMFESKYAQAEEEVAA